MNSLVVVVLVFLFLVQIISAELRASSSNPWNGNNRKIDLTASCAVPNAQKRDCGFNGITQSQCQTRGCCWAAGGSGIPWCFYAATDAPTRQPTRNPTARPTSARPTTRPPSAAPTSARPTAKPTSAAPTTQRPSANPTVTPVPTAPVPTARPTVSSAPTTQVTTAPSLSGSEAPTDAPTLGDNGNATVASLSSHSKSSKSTIGIVLGAIIGGILVIGSIFLYVVFRNLYQSGAQPAPVKHDIEADAPKINMMAELKKINSAAQLQQTHSHSRHSIRDDSSFYSLYSKGNQSQITEVELNREDLQQYRNNPAILPPMFEEETDDQSVDSFEGVYHAGNLQWCEGRDHSFVTP